MRKLFIILMVIGTQFLYTGCELLENNSSKPAEPTKTLPCGSQYTDKETSEAMQSWHPCIVTDLMVNVDGQHVKVADVTVYTVCGGCWIYISNVTECWELMDIRAWVGKNIIDLKNVSANPAMFTDLTINELGLGSNYIVYPYENGWYCNDLLNFAVWAKARNTCNADCGELVMANATIATWDLRAGNNGTVDAGDVKVAIVDNYLEVTYILAAGWSLWDAHLEINTDLNQVPVSGGPNPNYFNFDYNYTGQYFSNNKFRIPLSELQGRLNYTCNENWLYTLAHATVVKYSPSYTILSAWAGNINMGGGCTNGAKYFKFKMPCPVERTCDYDSWGKGTDGQEFRDIDLDQFGWYFQCGIHCSEE